MSKQITVYDENNVIVGMTFERRAKQLVSKKRANWLDDTCSAIYLTPVDQEEESKMERDTFDYRTNDGYATPEIREAVSVHDKDTLLFLARKNVKDKKNLFRHIIAFLIAWPVWFFAWAAFLDAYHNGGIVAIFLLGMITAWGIFIIRRVCSYVIPHLKELFPTNRAKRDPIEAEYDRLKNMKPDRIAVELERA